MKLIFHVDFVPRPTEDLWWAVIGKFWRGRSVCAPIDCGADGRARRMGGQTLTMTTQIFEKLDFLAEAIYSSKLCFGTPIVLDLHRFVRKENNESA